MDILLIESDYESTYPPLGLIKLVYYQDTLRMLLSNEDYVLWYAWVE